MCRLKKNIVLWSKENYVFIILLISIFFLGFWLVEDCFNSFKNEFNVIQPLLTLSSILVAFGKDAFCLKKSDLEQLTKSIQSYYNHTTEWVFFVWLSIFFTLSYAICGHEILLRLAFSAVYVSVCIVFLLAIFIRFGSRVKLNKFVKELKHRADDASIKTELIDC